MVRLSLYIFALLLFGNVVAQDKVTVYKSPTCGCCKKWISHLEQNGFKVRSVDMANVSPKKLELGINPRLASCHTAVIDGYVIEGHVPARDIRQLLKDRPNNIHGLTVPGMPVGSPGMEMGKRKDPYAVLSIDKQGGTAVYSRY